MTTVFERAAIRLRCPNGEADEHPGLVSYELIVTPNPMLSKATFLCTACGFRWTATETQLRLMLENRSGAATQREGKQPKTNHPWRGMGTARGRMDEIHDEQDESP